MLHVADDRTAETLAGYFDGLSIEDRLAIEAIAMDMWDPYRKTVRDYVPDGDTKIVFDRFHVMRHVIEAMDQVRRRENRALAPTRRQAADRDQVPLAENAGRRRPTSRRRAAGSSTPCAKSTLKSARAWAMKDAFRHIWDYRSIPAARAFFARWEAWARSARGSGR